MRSQRGGLFVGFIAGLLVGLALALGVALYVTKVPVPFIDKVPQRTADQDAAEAERNRKWNPNEALASKVPVRPASAPASGVALGASAPAGLPPANADASLPAVATSGSPVPRAQVLMARAMTTVSPPAQLRVSLRRMLLDSVILYA